MKLKGICTLLVIASLSIAVEPVSAYPLTRISPIASTPFDRRLEAAGAFREFSTGGPRAPMDRAHALFSTARSFRYTPDRAADRWQPAEETEARRSGDCEDKAVWLYAKLRAAGFDEARLVVGKYRPTDRNFHVWVTLETRGGQLILDPSAQKKIWLSTDFRSSEYRPLYSFDRTLRFKHES